VARSSPHLQQRERGRGARVIDARGKFLISGLYDSHVHTLLDRRDVASGKVIGRESSLPPEKSSTARPTARCIRQCEHAG
jgi:imidazolonepropionase-like amidohydrolase